MDARLTEFNYLVMMSKDKDMLKKRAARKARHEAIAAAHATGGVNDDRFPAADSEAAQNMLRAERNMMSGEDARERVTIKIKKRPKKKVAPKCADEGCNCAVKNEKYPRRHAAVAYMCEKCFQ